MIEKIASRKEESKLPKIGNNTVVNRLAGLTGLLVATNLCACESDPSVAGLFAEETQNVPSEDAASTEDTLTTSLGDAGTSATETGEKTDAGNVEETGTDGSKVIDAGTSADVKNKPTCGVLMECGGICVDTQHDNHNCGNCGITCKTGDACFAGICIDEKEIP